MSLLDKFNSLETSIYDFFIDIEKEDSNIIMFLASLKNELEIAIKIINAVAPGSMAAEIGDTVEKVLDVIDGVMQSPDKPE